MQEKIVLAKQRAAQRAEQAIQDMVDRLKQGEARVREFDAEMRGIAKKYKALKVEKEAIEAECERIKKELEGDFAASEGMTDVPASDISTQNAPAPVMQSPTRPIPYHLQTEAGSRGTISTPTKLQERAGDSANESASGAAGESKHPFAHPQTPSHPEPQTPTHLTTPTPNRQLSGFSERYGDTAQIARPAQESGWPENVITSPKIQWSTVFASKGIEDFEVVTLIDGKWTEVRCGVCRKNAMRYGKTPQYIGGIGGLYVHVKSHFKERDDMSADETFRHITRREVSQEDVQLMLAGKAPKDVTIPMDEGPVKPKVAFGTKRKAGSPQAFTPSKKLNASYGGSMKDDEEIRPKRES